LSAAALNSRRNRNFVHRKGKLSGGGVGPVFAGVAPAWRGPAVALLAKELVALEPDVILGQATPGTTALQADAGPVTPFQ
jgi:hypothetical protein